jgi:BirA family biotin operon repressor/biotin-[acetyl-CoA-carboxylase] ligase
MSAVAEASRRFGSPRLHLRATDSTNVRARELAGRGVPDGTLVTAGEQSAGRGRQGRTWSAPAGRSLLCSIVIREPPRLLPLAAGVAVAEVVAQVVARAADSAGRGPLVKWPNDVLLGGRKIAGILVEGRPQEGWAVLGIGLNVALAREDFPPELRETAATLGLGADQIEPVLERLLRSLERWVAAGEPSVLEAVRARDALRGRSVRWSGGEGVGAGIDDGGRLLVESGSGGVVALDAGEVHLGAVR